MIPIKELEALILYWKEKQGDGRKMDDQEKLLMTIVILEDVRGLLKSGIVKFTPSNHENYRK